MPLDPRLQALASRRAGGSGSSPSPGGGRSASALGANRAGGGGGTIDPAGLISQRTGGGTPTAQPGASGGTPTPQPGVSGVTPGAVERRIGGSPPTQAVGGQGAPGADFAPPGLFTNKPNQSGPGRGDFSAPLGNLENFLRTMQSKNRQDR